jgi:hypothetical protein
MTPSSTRDASAGRIRTVAATLSFVLVAIAAGGATAMLVYLFQASDPANDRSLAFYAAIGLIAAIAGVIGQLAVLRRRRGGRGRWTFTPRLRVQATGRHPRAPSAAARRATTLDAAAVELARAARASGTSWPDVCRLLHADWERLDAVERRLFEHAVTAAVDERPRRES